MAGRPTKLTEAVIQKARHYVEKGWREQRHAVPMIEGLALAIDSERHTVKRWVDEPPTEPYAQETAKQFAARQALYRQFSTIVNRLETIQAIELGSGALKGKLNARTANMMLSRHGYVERKETDLTSKGNELKGASIVFSDEPTED